MSATGENWRAQIRRGYLELCILLLIKQQKRLYGFDLIARLQAVGIAVKEGTLYPLLNRMTTEGVLGSTWETENIKGHPRKFYALTTAGEQFLSEMVLEFQDMVRVFEGLLDQKPKER